MTTEELDLISTRQVAEMLKLSVWTVRKKIREGTFRPYKVGKVYRYKRADILDYLERQKVSN